MVQIENLKSGPFRYDHTLIFAMFSAFFSWEFYCENFNFEYPIEKGNRVKVFFFFNHLITLKCKIRYAITKKKKQMYKSIYSNFFFLDLI
jgi:hypothetical protein